MSFRYIGSKSRLVDQIQEFIGQPNGGMFVDAFCGTGAVAEAAAELGWPVRINDHLQSAVISTHARLLGHSDARFETLGGYHRALATLNALAPVEGFIWREYSPASARFCGIERRYFTEANAGRIDAIRAQIGAWAAAGTISDSEKQLLIADLFGALNRVANIAGTFGCFLALWTPQASETLCLRPRKLKPERFAVAMGAVTAPAARVEASVGDVFDVPAAQGDVVYLDPPYTKRQYASYYHILETVALGDEPVVEGVAGLRPWQDRASDFCYKVRALKTLTRLVEGLAARRILLSYSSEGHISVPELRGLIERVGTSEMHPLGSIGRYRPNKTASSRGSAVKEYLVVIDRDGNHAAPQPAAARRQANLFA
jgi:adenine-specific DNA-methyltransferase